MRGGSVSLRASAAATASAAAVKIPGYDSERIRVDKPVQFLRAEDILQSSGPNHAVAPPMPAGVTSVAGTAAAALLASRHPRDHLGPTRGHHVLLDPAAQLLSPVSPAHGPMRKPKPKPEPAEVRAMLGSAVAWGFDIFRFARATGGYPCTSLGGELFRLLDLGESLWCDEARFVEFCRRVDEGYRDLPYHNNIHGADVAQAMGVFLHTYGMSARLPPLEVAACVVACLIHDLDHPGTNNAFQAATLSDFSLAYSDRSVLESFHLSRGFTIMSETGLIGNMDTVTYKAFRKVVVELVLATDMGSHFEIMSKFTARAEPQDGAGVDLTKDPADRLLFMKLAIKTSDISNPCRSLDIHRQWTAGYIEETFNQGDMERKLSLPISPFMDRMDPQVPKCEVGFFEFIIMPMWKAWAGQISVQEPMMNLNKNLAYWKEELKRAPTLVPLLSDFEEKIEDMEITSLT